MTLCLPDSDSGFPMQDIAHLLFDRYRAVSGDRLSVERLFRTIVVVGAGASHAACGLPRGNELADAVEQNVVGGGIPKRLIDAELHRLERIYRLPPTDLETRLLAIGKYDQKTVLDVLCEKCDVAHYPSLTYEILAHLMKHGFLDAIVNFNFDELLDQAIDEEVGAERYVRIVRDGDWSRKLRTDTDGHDHPWRFDRPLYIKPHGTVSEPASLRFTREAYFALPPDTARLLDVLVSGAPANEFLNSTAECSSSSSRPVCLLVLGHALQSFEFNTLLEKSPSESRLYVATFDDGDARADPQKEWNAKMRTMAKDRSIPIIGEGALDNLMRTLWSEIARQAKANVETTWMGVRGIVRHELIASLFCPTHPGNLKRRDDSRRSSEHKIALDNYLRDRFFIEVMLAIAKAKGFIDLRELHRGRTGYFYNKLSDSARGDRPVAYYLEQFGMERRDSSSESYWHNNVPRGSTAGSNSDSANGNDEERLTLDKETRDETCCSLIAACSALLSPNRKKRLANLAPMLMKETLTSMFDGEEVEIAPARPVDFWFKFQNARAVRTFAELRHETQILLTSPWQLLLCVAESGGWLLHPYIQSVIILYGRKVGIIIADTVDTEQLTTLNVQVRRLHWHLHNRHMTIRLVKSATGELAADRAIYFERRYRSPLISPVVLTKDADLERVMDDFTVYWLKAERQRNGKSEVIAFAPKELRQKRKTMLDELLGDKAHT